MDGAKAMLYFMEADEEEKLFVIRDVPATIPLQYGREW